MVEVAHRRGGGRRRHPSDAGEDARRSAARRGGGFRHFVQTDNAPAVPLALVTVLLGLFVFSQNANFLSAFNISNILLLATALGFIALGQTVAILSSGIDLSVGPAGRLPRRHRVVLHQSTASRRRRSRLGFALMFVAAFVVGAINGLLIRFANFTPIAATLAMYIGLQGCSFLLRDGPDGYISYDVIDMDHLAARADPRRFPGDGRIRDRGRIRAAPPAARLAASRGRLGRGIGAPDGHPRSTARSSRAYIASSLFTALGAVMLMAQIGVGDPQQGANYTLSSITAVVLGGTSLRGGRGTFIGTVLGAVLLTEVLNAISFLGLSQTYQYVFQGALDPRRRARLLDGAAGR